LNGSTGGPTPHLSGGGGGGSGSDDGARVFTVHRLTVSRNLYTVSYNLLFPAAYLDLKVITLEYTYMYHKENAVN
jgi:hypothetical protein